MKFAINPPAIKLKKSNSPAMVPTKFCPAEITQSIGEPVLQTCHALCCRYHQM